MPKIEWNKKKIVIMSALVIMLLFSIYQYIENRIIEVDVSYCNQSQPLKESSSTGSTNVTIETGEKIQIQYSQRWIENCCIISVNDQSEMLLDCHKDQPIVLRKE